VKRASLVGFLIRQHPDHHLPNGQLDARRVGFALLAIANNELNHFSNIRIFAYLFLQYF
jgi:hypothetical protein